MSLAKRTPGVFVCLFLYHHNPKGLFESYIINFQPYNETVKLHIIKINLVIGYLIIN